MTAQCAPYMGAMRIFGTPWPCPHHGYFLPKFSWAFVVIDTMNMRTKFEVCIALPVPGLIGVAKNCYAHTLYPPPPKKKICMPRIQTIYLCALVFPRFLIAVLSGRCDWRTPNFGEQEAVWVRDGTIRKSVIDFL